jgi:ribosomal-protein-alanine N-acetyltransferase
MGGERMRTENCATIRNFCAADARAVAEIMGESPEAANWTEDNYRETAGGKGVVALVSEAEEKVTGFLVGRQVGDEAEILNFAVAPCKRGQGEGGALLRMALEEFRSRGVSCVFLEVRESNEKGIAFYEKHGFAKTGRRPGYYRDPEQAAILMEMKITG